MTQLDWLLLYKELQTRKFKGDLDLPGLQIPSWFRIPDNLTFKGFVNLSGTNISKLPNNLQCKNLYLYDCKNIKQLPGGLKVKYTINLTESSIEQLPENLKCEHLWLDNCKNLKELPEGLNVEELHISKTKLTKEYCFQMKREGKISYKNLYN